METRDPVFTCSEDQTNMRTNAHGSPHCAVALQRPLNINFLYCSGYGQRSPLTDLLRAQITSPSLLCVCVCVCTQRTGSDPAWSN